MNGYSKLELSLFKMLFFIINVRGIIQYRLAVRKKSKDKILTIIK